MALDDAGDDVGEVGVWLDADELARLDQRGSLRPMLAAAVRASEQGVLAVQGQGPDRALDDVGIDLDPAVVEEQAQAGPAREGVADRIGEFALAADQAELLAQPWLQGFDHWSTSFLTHGTPLVGRATTDLGFDPIQRGDACQRLLGDRRGGGEFVEEPPCVAPTIGQPDGAAFGQHLVGRIAIDLQHAFEPSQMRDRPAGGAVGRVDVGDTGWIGSAPGPVVTGVSPELAGLGAPAPGIEHGCRGLVGKQLTRALQRLQQTRVHRPEQEGRAPDPVGQRRTVEGDTLTGEDLRLSVERQVVGVFGDEHLCDQRVGRQAALDQPHGCWGLHERVLAGPAGVTRAADHQNPELRRHHVEALGYVLADLVQDARAARAGGAVDVDEGLDPQQVGRQSPAIGAALEPPGRFLCPS